MWLSPTQVVIIPVADRHIEYASFVEKKLCEAGLRIKLDSRTERMGNKIRQAQSMKIPCMVILGDKEVNEGTISVRLRSGEQRNNMETENVTAMLGKTVMDKNAEIKL